MGYQTRRQPAALDCNLPRSATVPAKLYKRSLHEWVPSTCQLSSAVGKRVNYHSLYESKSRRISQTLSREASIVLEPVTAKTPSESEGGSLVAFGIAKIGVVTVAEQVRSVDSIM